ncbi:MAG: sulfur carrier protein ThiS adenylyltransferase ThiF [Desulfovibrionaceae bacterium]|nr:sulfur carrier protein ThiS adenylyltransferase ThiF [Desulfovibrionaceae bacterium]
MSLWHDVLGSFFNDREQKILAEARIGIIGAGGLGSNAAFMLARSGIGHFIIADGDTVSVSNLNRQHYFPEHLGKPKVEALKEQLLRLRPELDVQILNQTINAEDIDRIFQGCNVVVEAVDKAMTKKILIETMVRSGFCVVSASGMAGIGGPNMTLRRVNSRLFIAGDQCSDIASKPPLSPRVSIAAGLEADAVLQILLAKKSADA